MQSFTFLSLHSYLSEADLSIIVFINFFDHGLEAQVSLGFTKLLHHQLQLHEVNEIAVVYIVPVCVCVCVCVCGACVWRERGERKSC